MESLHLGLICLLAITWVQTNLTLPSHHMEIIGTYFIRFELRNYSHKQGSKVLNLNVGMKWHVWWKTLLNITKKFCGNEACYPSTNQQLTCVECCLAHVVKDQMTFLGTILMISSTLTQMIELLVKLKIGDLIQVLKPLNLQGLERRIKHQRNQMEIFILNILKEY